MGFAVHAEHLRRYRDIAWLLWKHGRGDLLESSGLGQAVGSTDYKERRAAPETAAAAKAGESDEAEAATGPDALARDLESLGPSFVKLGQMLASRADLLPPPYLQALSRLHDDVEPVPFEQIEEVLSAELNARPARIFSEIQERPLAAASLAQVHVARLRDGREVVVKVQRPGVEEQIRVDFEAFAALAKLAGHSAFGRKYHLEDLVAEFRRTIEEELDYRSEAGNLLAIRKNLAEFKLIQVPEPVLDFSSRRVLTMERLSGTSVSAVSPVVFTEIDGSALAEELFAAYLKQMLVDGFFHADPHPGNVLLTLDRRLGLIDLGMVGRLDAQLQDHLLNLLIAVSEGRGHEAGEVALRIGNVGPRFDREEFLRRVTELVLQHGNVKVADIQAGRVVLEIQKIAGDTGVQLPRSLTLMGKALLNLDTIGRCLAPGFDPNAAIRQHAMGLVRRRLWGRMSPGNLLQSALEMSEFTAQLPKRLNELLTQVGKSGIRLDVDAFDEKTFVSGFQKVANRIAAGLILAALIIGAALLMRIETSFTLLGYPGLAILLFLAAAAGGTVLLFEVFVTDRRGKDG